MTAEKYLTLSSLPSCPQNSQKATNRHRYRWLLAGGTAKSGCRTTEHQDPHPEATDSEAPPIAVPGTVQERPVHEPDRAFDFPGLRDLPSGSNATDSKR